MFQIIFLLKNDLLSETKEMNKKMLILVLFWIVCAGCSKNDNSPEILPSAPKPLRNADYYITTAESINVRSQATTKSESIAKLNSGIFVIFIEDSKKEEVISGKKSSWLKVELNDGKIGYIFGGFLISKKDAFKKIVSTDNSLENRKFIFNSKESGEYLSFSQNNIISLEGNCTISDPDDEKKSQGNDCFKQGIYQKIGNYVFILIDDEEFLMEIAPLPDNREEYALRQIEPASGSKEDIFHKEFR
mgnify:CR=1 FL=1